MTDTTRETKQLAIEELRKDAATVDRAIPVLVRRGAHRLATQASQRVAEWTAQAAEMERRL